MARGRRRRRDRCERPRHRLRAGVSALIAARRKRLEGFERTAPNPPVDRAGRANDRRRVLAAALLRLTPDTERADGGGDNQARSEERRGGKEGVSTGRTWGVQNH